MGRAFRPEPLKAVWLSSCIIPNSCRGSGHKQQASLLQLHVHNICSICSAILAVLRSELVFVTYQKSQCDWKANIGLTDVQ